MTHARFDDMNATAGVSHFREQGFQIFDDVVPREVIMSVANS
jgi:hypothetical protein